MEIAKLFDEFFPTVGISQPYYTEAEVRFIRTKMCKFVAEVFIFNRRMNLVAAETPEQIAKGHVLDCLAAVEFLQQKILEGEKSFVAADLGSGAGFPGIPLACAFPKVEWTLIERMEKRVTFLMGTVAQLGLTNINVEQKDFLDLPENTFDFVTFRAFRPLGKTIVKGILRLLKPGGTALAYKGKIENILEEMQNVADLLPSYKTFPLNCSFLPGRERHLVTFTKPAEN